VHLNLLGFMSMMIYGVGYHILILPRFSGRPVYSPLLMRIQFWFANPGLIGMAVSWPFTTFTMRDVIPGVFNPALIISAFCSLIAVAFFCYKHTQNNQTCHSLISFKNTFILFCGK